MSVTGSSAGPRLACPMPPESTGWRSRKGRSRNNPRDPAITRSLKRAPLQEIAEAIGRGLKVPVAALAPDEVARHFGFLGRFVGADCPASSALTQERLGWRPTMQPGLIEDLERAIAFEA